MSLEQAAYVAEIMASFATLVTLVYLSIQIRRSNQLSYTESRRASNSVTAQLATILGESQETSDFFMQGLLDNTTFSPSEELRFDFMFSLVVSNADLAFADYEMGIVDQAAFDNGSGPLLKMLNLPGGRSYWKKYGKASRQTFYEYIETKI